MWDMDVFGVCFGSSFSLHRSVQFTSFVIRAEKLRCLAERVTALATAEEAIAVDFKTVVDSVLLSKAMPPSSTPREFLQATREAMAASRTRPRALPEPRLKKAPRRSTAIITTPRGSVALDGAVCGLAAFAAPTVLLESLHHCRRPAMRCFVCRTHTWVFHVQALLVRREHNLLDTHRSRVNRTEETTAPLWMARMPLHAPAGAADRRPTGQARPDALGTSDVNVHTDVSCARSLRIKRLCSFCSIESVMPTEFGALIGSLVLVLQRNRNTHALDVMWTRNRPRSRVNKHLAVLKEPQQERMRAGPRGPLASQKRNRDLCWSHDPGVSLREQAFVGMRVRGRTQGVKWAVFGGRALEVIGKYW